MEQQAEQLKQAADLLARISPTIALPGREPLTYAIFCAVELFRQDPPPEVVRVTEMVYVPAAKMLGKDVSTIVKASARALKCCWMDGRNRQLNAIIGTELPACPSIKEFVLCCGYYLAFKIPYYKTMSSIMF